MLRFRELIIVLRSFCSVYLPGHFRFNSASPHERSSTLNQNWHFFAKGYKRTATESMFTTLHAAAHSRSGQLIKGAVAFFPQGIHQVSYQVIETGTIVINMFIKQLTRSLRSLGLYKPCSLILCVKKRATSERVVQLGFAQAALAWPKCDMHSVVLWEWFLRCVHSSNEVYTATAKLCTNSLISTTHYYSYSLQSLKQCNHNIEREIYSTCQIKLNPAVFSFLIINHW